MKNFKDRKFVKFARRGACVTIIVRNVFNIHGNFKLSDSFMIKKRRNIFKFLRF